MAHGGGAGPGAVPGAPRYGPAVAATVVGSLLGTPSVSCMDQGILFIAGWLVLGAGTPFWLLVLPVLAVVPLARRPRRVRPGPGR